MVHSLQLINIQSCLKSNQFCDGKEGDSLLQKSATDRFGWRCNCCLTLSKENILNLCIQISCHGWRGCNGIYLVYARGAQISHAVYSTLFKSIRSPASSLLYCMRSASRSFLHYIYLMNMYNGTSF